MTVQSVLPKSIRFFIHFFFRDDLAETLTPDIEEEYLDLQVHTGKVHLFFWTMFQCTGLILSGINHKIFWSIVLLKQNLRIAFRNLVRYKRYSVLNIFGLSVGLACSIIVILYVNHELTYDHYHPDYDRIYRIDLHRVTDLGDYWFATHCTPMAEKLRTDFPQIEVASRFRKPLENSDHVFFRKGEINTFEDRIYFTDPDYFKIFKVSFLSGDPATSLQEPNSVVLTESLAKKYFGGENAYGKTIEIELDYDYFCPVEIEEFKVTGVIKDTPSNSHLIYNALVSYPTLTGHVPGLEDDWMAFQGTRTYVKLREGASADEVNKELVPVSEDLRERMQKLYNLTSTTHDLFLQPVYNIYLFSKTINEYEAKGNIYYLYIYSFISLLILVIGCLNYMNLTASIYSTRIREIGIRKVIGANRSSLHWQFVSESLLTTGIAFFLALFLATILFPFFNDFTGTNLSLANLGETPILISIITLYLLVSVTSSLYPSIVLSSYKPIQVMKGKLAHKSSGSTFQRIMVLGQFAASIFLIISALTVYRQLDFMRNSALGFDKEHKVILPIYSNRNFFMNHTEVVKDEFEKIPEVVNATASAAVPGDLHYVCYTKRMDIADAKPEQLNIVTIDYDFINVYGLKMVVGRPFEEKRGEEEYSHSLILNESAVKQMGFASPEEALGKECWGHYNGSVKTIIGVVKDFHFIGMHNPIQPIRFEIDRSLYEYLTLTISGGDVRKTLDEIQKAWDVNFKDIPFNFFFLNESYDQQYRYEMQASKILGFITISGLIISLFGLLGLSSFITRQREKELGIRKVLGAGSNDIVLLLSKQFIFIITVSFILASTAGWYLMNLWLRDFAYRVNQSIITFILVGLATLLLALLTVGLHGLKVSRNNPVDSIRSE